MPAMLDDPTAPTIYRTSGEAIFSSAMDNSFPADIVPRQVTLRDRVTTATIVPFASWRQVPESLWRYLSDQLNKEIEMGDTYPMIEGMTAEKFAAYWFQNFGAIMILGHIERAEDVVEGPDWSTQCLGSFYIKPNYPGRSSHVCNAGFLVTNAARNRGVGRLMGEQYLEWAPRLGYTYSVFNLVYDTNVASCRIWDALGFKRIGRVPGCGSLKSYPGRFIDAIIYGRDLVSDPFQYVTEERFDKIKFYLKTGSYPAGADRAEKSRLRSAATHYKLIPGQDADGRGEKLMLKDKEVISDPNVQYDIARETHNSGHGGINRTTSMIAERYHWVRIKETVSMVIKNCTECKEVGKPPMLRNDSLQKRSTTTTSPTHSQQAPTISSQAPDHFDDPFHSSATHLSHPSSPPSHLSPSIYNHPESLTSIRTPHHHPHSQNLPTQSYIDPQIMSDPQSHLTSGAFTHTHSPQQPPTPDPTFSTSSSHHHPHQHQPHEHHDPNSSSSHNDDSWNELVNHAPDPRSVPHPHHDGDLDMLLEDQDDEEEERDGGLEGDHLGTEDGAKERAQEAAKAAVASMRRREDVDMYDGGGGEDADYESR